MTYLLPTAIYLIGYVLVMFINARGRRQMHDLYKAAVEDALRLGYVAGRNEERAGRPWPKKWPAKWPEKWSEKWWEVDLAAAEKKPS